MIIWHRVLYGYYMTKTLAKIQKNIDICKFLLKKA